MTYDFARRLDAARLDDLFNLQFDHSSPEDGSAV
jgi:hypothetical protein